MSLVRRIARPLLAATFVYGGIDQARNPQGKVGMAGPVLDRLREPLRLPEDDTLVVQASGAAMVGAGLLLATGRAPRLSSLVLLATAVPTTVAGHRFWEEKDPEARAAQRLQFLKNAGMVGGLLLASVDTDGRPGLAWRTKRAGRDAKRSAKVAGHGARTAGRLARKDAKLLARTARAEAKAAAREGRSQARLAKVKVEAASPL